jgi:2-methylisocitrate lyase-like PEP mutase family enzyme
MATKFEQFNKLHQGPGLFVLPNAWNAKSAQILEQKNFPAIATSSAAVADSLGYEDGEQMPFSSYLFIIRRILASTKLPLSIDLEMGYGLNADDIYANILCLIELGVVGINLEDSTFDRGQRRLQDAKTFTGTLGTIASRLAKDNLDLFLNVRCDTYLLDVPEKGAETKRRIRHYEDSGASGIFLPCISKEEDIEAAVKNTRLPLNVMRIPGLPHLETLESLGVKRVSTGPFLFIKTYENLSLITN